MVRSFPAGKTCNASWMGCHLSGDFHMEPLVLIFLQENKKQGKQIGEFFPHKVGQSYHVTTPQHFFLWGTTPPWHWGCQPPPPQSGNPTMSTSEPRNELDRQSRHQGSNSLYPDVQIASVSTSTSAFPANALLKRDLVLRKAKRIWEYSLRSDVKIIKVFYSIGIKLHVAIF